MFKGTKLRKRIVIDIATAEGLGYVSDLEIDEISGCVTAIIVRKSAGLLGGVFHIGEVSIPWHCVVAMGNEFVLVKTFEFTEKCLKN